MEIKHTNIDGCLMLKTRVFADERGDFNVPFNQDELKNIGIDFNIKQVNVSNSHPFVIRGLHFQTVDVQAKLVSVLQGGVVDVVVDLRKNSPTFSHQFHTVLSRRDPTILYVPAGCAHGFVALDRTTFCYYVDAPYNPKAESGINPFDPELDISWKSFIGPKARIEDFIISDKDKILPSWNEFMKVNPF